MLPVVVGTNPDRSDWLRDCLRSIRETSRHRRIFIHRDGGYELTAIRAGMQRYKRFVYLHDSCEVLHPNFWTTIDSTGPTWLFGGPPMYLAVYDRDDLAPAIEDAPYGLDITKRISIVWEGELAKRLNYPTIWPDIHDGTAHPEERHGRANIVLGNHLIRKFKGNWGQPGGAQ